MRSQRDSTPTPVAVHEVMNQPGAFENHDLYSGDKPLVEAMRVFGADWAADQLKRAGVLVGSENYGDSALIDPMRRATPSGRIKPRKPEPNRQTKSAHVTEI
jgi:hypothetical protein